MSKKKFAVIGLGQFGSAIARKLEEKGAEVIAIDIDKEKVADIRENVSLAAVLDATDKKAILAQDIVNADAVLVCIGDLNYLNELLLCTFALQELKVHRIIVRAQGQTEKKILQKLGIKEILCPEDEVSINVAEKLLNPSVITCMELPDDFEILEIKAPRRIINRSLGEIKLREKYKLNLVTLLRQGKDGKYHIQGVPTVDSVIEKGDIILLFGKSNHIDRFVEINE